MADIALTDRELDVSGAMAGKLKAIASVSERIRAGMEVALFSMKEPGRLQAVLSGEDWGTKIIS
jgi:isopentenyl phosphate kinase